MQQPKFICQRGLLVLKLKKKKNEAVLRLELDVYFCSGGNRLVRLCSACLDGSAVPQKVSSISCAKTNRCHIPVGNRVLQGSGSARERPGPQNIKCTVKLILKMYSFLTTFLPSLKSLVRAPSLTIKLKKKIHQKPQQKPQTQQLEGINLSGEQRML